MSGKRIVRVQFQTSSTASIQCVSIFSHFIFFSSFRCDRQGDGSGHECELNFFMSSVSFAPSVMAPVRSSHSLCHPSSIRMRAWDLISIKKLIQQAPYCVCVFEFISLFLLHIPPSPQHKIESSVFWPVHSSVAEARATDGVWEIMLNSLEWEHNKNDNQWGDERERGEKTFLIFRFYHKNDAIKFYSRLRRLFCIFFLHHLDSSPLLPMPHTQHTYTYSSQRLGILKILVAEQQHTSSVESSNAATKIWYYMEFECQKLTR